jgi:hypothetical protein
LEGFSYVLQIDMHFICTPMLARFYFFVKSGCYTGAACIACCGGCTGC